MQIIDNRSKVKNQAKDFLKNLNNDVYIIGRNKYGSSLHKWLSTLNKNVIGYIDDFSSQQIFNGVPIIKSSSDFSDAAIINCVVEGQPINVRNLISRTNVRKSVDYFSLQFAFPEFLEEIDYMSETDKILLSVDKYNTIYNNLQDKKSRDEFEAIVNFRINHDPSFLGDFKFKLDEQYFEDFIALENESVFVDAGGFDGFTSFTFANRYSDYSKIFYFEPTLKSFNLSKEKLKEIRDVIYYQKGLWDSTTILKFESNLGNSSRISDSGEDKVEVVALDEIIKEKIDFIKIDIEGSEQKALLGCKNIIAKYKPVIAVCVYHKQDDFIDIPTYLLELNQDYKIYFRHYTQGVCESVMYFI